MDLNVEHLASRKAYLSALRSSLPGTGRCQFYYVDYRFPGAPANLGIVLLGPKLAALHKLVVTEGKGKVLDRGLFEDGRFAPTGNRLTSTSLIKLGIEDLAQLAGDGEESSASESSSTSSSSSAGAPKSTTTLTPEQARAAIAKLKADAEATHHDGVVDEARTLLKIAKSALEDDNMPVVVAQLAGVKKSLEAFAKYDPPLRTLFGRLGPVAAHHSDPDAKEIYELAQRYYRQGQFSACEDELLRFQNVFGHQPYVDSSGGASARAIGDDRPTVGQAAAAAPTVAKAYEQAKTALERRVAVLIANPNAKAELREEAKLLKTFFDKTATAGLKAKIEAAESAPAATRGNAVGKALVVVQAYIDALRKLPDHGVRADYVQTLQWVHAALQKAHPGQPG